MVDSKKNNRGFTLIEVMASMIILALLVLPLLSYFHNNMKINSKQKEVQSASVACQTIIEDVKTYKTIEELVNATNGADAKDERLVQIKSLSSPSDLKDETYASQIVGGMPEKYFFKAKNMKINNQTYEALIAVDTKPAGNLDKYENVNKNGLPLITSLDTNSIVAAESLESAAAVTTFYNQNQKAGGHATEKEIRRNLRKAIQIDIKEKSDTYYTISIYNRYTLATSLVGCTTPIESDMLYDEAVVKENFKNIYLFYNIDRMYKTDTAPDTTTIYVNIDENLKTDMEQIKQIKLLAICQGIQGLDNDIDDNIAEFNKDADSVLIYYHYMTHTDDSSQGTRNGTVDSVNANYYSNIKYGFQGTTPISPDALTDIVGTESIQRIAQIKVSVFPKGTYKETSKLAEFTSTRGE